MIHHLASAVLRQPEPKDLDALYGHKNDPEIASLLGGFSRGYARADLAEWLEYHRKAKDEVLWVIADPEDDRCVGHAGLYRVDHRVRSAEFAILLGDRAAWGRGIGKCVTRFVLSYGFEMLNLNRIELNLLQTNARALRLYQGLGFRQEGLLRQAQYKDGGYVDVIVMGLLRGEFDGDRG